MAADVIPLVVEIVSLKVPEFIGERIKRHTKGFEVTATFAEIDIADRFEQAMNAVETKFPTVSPDEL